MARSILVAGDYLTRWMEEYAILNQEEGTVAKKLTEETFLRFSPPEQLHLDMGHSNLKVSLSPRIAKSSG